jgi:hypothetical protein
MTETQEQRPVTGGAFANQYGRATGIAMPSVWGTSFMLTCLLSVFKEPLGNFVLHYTAADCRGLPVRIHLEGV